MKKHFPATSKIFKIYFNLYDITFFDPLETLIQIFRMIENQSIGDFDDIGIPYQKRVH